jgi:hypothetical protein
MLKQFVRMGPDQLRQTYATLDEVRRWNPINLNEYAQDSRRRTPSTAWLSDSVLNCSLH